MPRVKICGCTDERDVRAAVDAGADAVGVICDVPVDTPRAVSRARAAELLDAVPPFATATLVTMPETPDRAVDLVEAVAPDAVQLHGDLPRGDLAYVASKLDVPILQAVDAATPERAAAVADVVDAVVVDSLDETGAGGTGRTHDWPRTRDATRDLTVPVVLAGGLTPGNVGEAAATVDPFAVDVAGGVERADPADGAGRKEPAAVERFVARAKGLPVANPEARP